MNKYCGFENIDDIKEQFQSDCDNIKDEEILFASYGGGTYGGDAIILIQRDRKLYTVEVGHCSDYELEGDWEMIETNKIVLRNRKFEQEYHEEFIQFLIGFLIG